MKTVEQSSALAAVEGVASALAAAEDRAAAVAHVDDLVRAVAAVVALDDPALAEETSRFLALATTSRGGRLLADDSDASSRVASLYTDLARSERDASVERLLESYGGKPRRVLELVRRLGEGGVLQSTVAETLGIEPTYLSKVVARLAERDLLDRWAEGRHRRLVVTGLGRAALGPEPVTATAPAPAIAPVAVAAFVTSGAGHRARALVAVLGSRPALGWAVVRT